MNSLAEKLAGVAAKFGCEIPPEKNVPVVTVTREGGVISPENCRNIGEFLKWARNYILSDLSNAIARIHDVICKGHEFMSGHEIQFPSLVSQAEFIARFTLLRDLLEKTSQPDWDYLVERSLAKKGQKFLLEKLGMNGND